MLGALLLLVFGAALKGAPVLAIVALATPLLRRRSAAVRHAMWTFAVGTQLVLPGLTTVAPSWNAPLVEQPAWLADARAARADGANEGQTGTSGSPRNDIGSSASTLDGVANRAADGAPTSEATRRLGPVHDVVQTLTKIWLVGAALILLHLGVGTVGVWRLAMRGQRVLEPAWLALAHELALRIGISRPLTLLRGERLAVPVTWGVVYPVVLLPPEADSWDDEQRKYVLVHEMAHVRRFDALTQFIGQIALAIFWFNPLIWLAVARMRAEREHACDDYVLRAGTAPSRYVEDLLAMIRSIGLPNRQSTAPSFAALAMARPSEFEGRMLAILEDDTRRDPLSRRGVASGAIAAAAFAVAIAGFNPLAARESGTPAATAQNAPVRHAPVLVRASVSATISASAPAQVAAPARKAIVQQTHHGQIDSLLAAMRPDNNKIAILAQYAGSGDDSLLSAVLRAVPSLPRDGQKSLVLAHAAPAALRGDARLRDAYFAAVRSITSDEDRRTVLAHAAANSKASPAVASRVLQAIADMRSSHAASTALVDVSTRGLISSDSLRTLYTRIALALTSEDDRQRAVTALLMVTRAKSFSKP
jgi:beta-lactamase regulating signal transducer with metallopeptidase domain